MAKGVLFEESNLNFTKGNCYGVIGANGAGKEHFCEILSGEIEKPEGYGGYYSRRKDGRIKNKTNFQFDDKWYRIP